MIVRWFQLPLLLLLLLLLLPIIIIIITSTPEAHGVRDPHYPLDVPDQTRTAVTVLPAPHRLQYGNKEASMHRYNVSALLDAAR